MGSIEVDRLGSIPERGWSDSRNVLDLIVAEVHTLGVWPGEMQEVRIQLRDIIVVDIEKTI